MNVPSRDRSPDSASANTRYGELASILVKAIVAGHHAVGSLLPTEHELAQRYGVSRHTVRAALKLVQELGYISRKKSVGTIVENANPTVAYTQSIDSVDDLVRVAVTEVRAIETTDLVTLDRATARRLEAPVGSQWIRLSGPRVDVWKNRSPVAWADIYIDPSFGGIVDEIYSHPEVLISSIIERQYGRPIDQIRQVATATLLDASLADTLGVDPGSAGLRLVRHYRSADGRLLEVTDTCYPADRIAVSFQLKRSRVRG
ncbi:GntR family transcriptional regulator [Paraburkholderia sp. GAS334]|uniref:GntR family transcriptional regulator n=1 Tax=Paraburkholderia sp. GAS334 TaxID=3035131 RepID=UPI003D255254